MIELSVVRSPTITINTTGEAPPSEVAPPWLKKLYEASVKRNMKRMQSLIENFATRRGWKLTVA